MTAESTSQQRFTNERAIAEHEFLEGSGRSIFPLPAKNWRGHFFYKCLSSQTAFTSVMEVCKDRYSKTQLGNWLRVKWRCDKRRRRRRRKKCVIKLRRGD